ncbi:unnamed protein product [marine sediment metagenome]|uniref:Uncharacterized protein n=1 Tax=marine sediment metagenome TaxID=412755 RepID=X1PXA1_9ZZZZ
MTNELPAEPKKSSFLERHPAQAEHGQVESQAKKPSVFTVCQLAETEDGHIEAACQTKEAARQLADLLEKEVIIRVKPKVTEVQTS